MARFGTKGAAQSAMVLSVVAFVGEHRADARHDREGGQEQPLEGERVVDVCRCGDTGDRHASAGLLLRSEPTENGSDAAAPNPTGSCNVRRVSPYRSATFAAMRHGTVRGG